MYLYEGGDIKQCETLKNIMTNTTTNDTKLSPMMVNTSVRLMRNENRFTASMDASVIVYKSLKDDGSRTFSRVDSATESNMRKFFAKVTETK